MKKNILIFFVIIFAVFVVVAVFFMYNQPAGLQTKNLSKASDSQIVFLLNKNSDAKDYLKSHSDFKIDKKELLTKESIAAGQNGQNFKEVYQGLELQDNRYMRLDLMNQAGNSGLIAVIDSKTNTTIKAYGLVLLKATQSQIQNGQIPIPTTNK